MLHEAAGCDIQQREKVAKATHSTGRDRWISPVVKGELCEKQVNYADNWRAVWGSPFRTRNLQGQECPITVLAPQ